MDEAIAFLTDFIEKEFEARDAHGAEYAVWQEKMEAVRKLMASIDIALSRPPDLSPAAVKGIHHRRRRGG